MSQDSASTVLEWRRALGVDAFTEGTRRLKSERFGPHRERVLAALPTLSSPERGAKISESRRGKARPPHVVEAVRLAHLGTPHSEETRRRMGNAHRARGTRPPLAGKPWTPDEDHLVMTLKAPEAAARTGRTLTAVYSRRLVLKVPDARKSWTARDDELVRTLTPAEAAARAGRTLSAVYDRRQALELSPLPTGSGTRGYRDSIGRRTTVLSVPIGASAG